jgi:hypothetical protein
MLLPYSSALQEALSLALAPKAMPSLWHMTTQMTTGSAWVSLALVRLAHSSDTTVEGAWFRAADFWNLKCR